jgi:TRAP-type C4-dicarboxylate transport system permease large subunit
VTTHAACRRADATIPTLSLRLAASGQASIASLILAGLLPAILLSVCDLGAAYRRRHQRATRPLRGPRRGARALASPRPCRAPGEGRHPGGIGSGIFTATEGRPVAGSTPSSSPSSSTARLPGPVHGVGRQAAKTTAWSLLLIGVSTMFGYLMGLYSVADLAGEAMAGISTNPWVIFFLINLILFILGTFMDMASTILICTPIFLPSRRPTAWIRSSSGW